MSGHSKWHSIRHSKTKNDLERSKHFNKLIKEIIVSVRLGGSDENANPRLKLALKTARQKSLPKKNIINAIKRGDGKNENDNYVEAIYECITNNDISFIIDTITDNSNRTLTDLKKVCSKNNARIVQRNNIIWMFDNLGFIIVKQKLKSDYTEDILEKKYKELIDEDFSINNISPEEVNLIASDELISIKEIESNIVKIIEGFDNFIVLCEITNLHKLVENIENINFKCINHGTLYIAKDDYLKEISDDDIIKDTNNLIEKIEDIADVKTIHNNILLSNEDFINQYLE